MPFSFEAWPTLTRKCPQGHELDPFLDALKVMRFCDKCGKRLNEESGHSKVLVCSHCRRPVSSLANYCPYCGQPGKEAGA